LKTIFHTVSDAGEGLQRAADGAAQAVGVGEGGEGGFERDASAAVWKGGSEFEMRGGGGSPRTWTVEPSVDHPSSKAYVCLLRGGVSIG
jgi:hypothetical protein